MNPEQVVVKHLVSKMLYSALAKTIENLDFNLIPNERKALLLPLINYIKEKVSNKEEINLNFICTHNSRRSQFSQLWAQTAAYYYGINANCFSGGVEVTAFNERAVASIERVGFQVSSQGKENPNYTVSFAEEAQPLIMLSKLFDDSTSPLSNFAAIMTCSHADENCPFIPGAEARIPLLYEDPKAFDGTNQEAKMYNKRSLQIANELFFVFSQVQ